MRIYRNQRKLFDIKEELDKHRCSNKVQEMGLYCGSTACVAIITSTEIVIGNAGDSRCVFMENGKAMSLTIDHKPIRPDET